MLRTRQAQTSEQSLRATVTDERLRSESEFKAHCASLLHSRYLYIYYRHREGCLSLYIVYIYDIDTPLCKSHAVYTGRILQGGGGISGAVG